jgi:protein TonB
MRSQARRSVAAMGSPLALAGPAREPLARMFGREDDRSELFYAACAAALTLHLAFIGFAMAGDLLKDLRLALADNRARLHEYFWRQYEVEVAPKPKVEEKAPEPPPEPEPPPPVPAPAPKLPAPKDDDPYKNLPAAPTPAKAAAVLVQKENPDEPRDLTANTIVNGDGTATYGQQSAAGTGDKPTLNAHPSLTGVPGGRGTASAAPPPPPPGPDLSRNIGLTGSTAWNCPFPAEADAEQIDQAVVTVQVTVRPDGSALSASVVSGGDHGFGRNAKACALTRRYTPALDRTGTAILSSAPVIVRFNR